MDTQDPTLQTPDAQTTSDMTPEEMTADLKQLMDSIDEKMNTFNGMKKASDSQIAQSQKDAIEQLFTILQNNGVDPSNQDSVNQFLQQLQERSPQIYQIFENAVNGLLGQEGIQDKMQPPEGFAEPLNPMDQMGQEPTSPPGIAPAQMPIPNPIPQSMNQPDSQAPLPQPN